MENLIQSNNNLKIVKNNNLYSVYNEQNVLLEKDIERKSIKDYNWHKGHICVCYDIRENDNFIIWGTLCHKYITFKKGMQNEEL